MPSLVLAQSYGFDRLLDLEIIPYILSIVAIIAVAAVLITIVVTRHRERMEKIRLGMNPDDPSPERNENTSPRSEQ